MKLSVSLAMVASATLFVPAISSASTETIRVTVPFSYNSTQLGAVDDLYTFVPKFNPAKGTLTKVTIRAFVRSSGSFVAENTLSGNPDPWSTLIKVTANVAITPSGAATFNAPVDGTWRNMSFANYDRTLDYKGTSATTMNFSGSKMTIMNYTNPAVLNAFKGVGNADISFSPSFSHQVQWFEVVPTNYQLPVRSTLTGTVGIGVVYTYTPA